MKAVFHDIQSKTLFGANAINISILTCTLKNALKLFSDGAAPRTPLGKLTTLPILLSRLGFPTPTTPKRLGSAPRLRFPFCGVQKILNLYYATMLSALWALCSNRHEQGRITQCAQCTVGPPQRRPHHDGKHEKLLLTC